MPHVIFKPEGIEIEVNPGTKILAAAIRSKVAIRYGCGACLCGTCGVMIMPQENCELSPMQDDERNLLHKMGLDPDDGTRLACRTKIQAGTCIVDLDFQHSYSP